MPGAQILDNVQLLDEATTPTKTGQLLRNGDDPQFRKSTGAKTIPTLVGTTLFTVGSVPFVTAAGELQQNNANFFWDNTNFRLGLKTNTPATTFDLNGQATFRSWADFIGIAQPAAPAAGTCRLHAFTTNGFTRMEQDNEAPTNITLGRDSVFIARNTSGAGMSIGQTVYVTGHTGQVPNIALARANSLATLPAVGICLDAIANNAFGQVMLIGILASFNTTGFATGDELWVSTAAAGGLTNVRPVSPLYAQRIGSVLDSNVNGTVLVDTAPFIGGQESGTTSAYTFGGTVTFSTMTSGSVLFAGASGLLSQDNSKFFWDNTNFRLGLLTAAPATTLDIAAKFQVDSNGNLVKINNVAYSWPAADAAGYLKSNGAGTLTWNAGTATLWNAIGDPGGNQSLTMAARLSTWTWNDTSANNLFTITDTAGNTGTGYLVNFVTTNANRKPFHVSANGADSIMVLGSGNVGINYGGPVTYLHVRGTGTAYPATSGSAQSAGHRVRIDTGGGGSATCDIGMGTSSETWIQCVANSNLATNFNLLLNPNGGNVGIGVTVPGSQLEVGSSTGDSRVKVSTAAASVAGINLNANSTNWFIDNVGSSSSPNNRIRFFFGSELFTILSTGSVGIGTTNPAALLHVAATLDGYVQISDNATGKYAFNAFRINNVDKGYLGWNVNDAFSAVGTAMILQNTQGKLHLRDNSATGITVSGGLVGIGTTTPYDTLEVSKSSSGALTTPLLVHNPNAVNGTGTGIGFLCHTDGTITGQIQNYRKAVSDYPLTFSTYNAGGLHESMRIDKDGNVGIGTTGPLSLLSVGGAGNATITLRTYGSDSTSSNFAFNAVNSSTQNLFTVRNDGVCYFSTSYVGVGLVPTHLFQVNSDDAAKPGATGLWTVISDERIKENISLADLDRCYEIVKTVPLKRFTFKDSAYSKEQVRDRSVLGWIAQDIKTIFPKAVAEGEFTLTETNDKGEEVKTVITDCLDLNAGQIIAALYGTVQSLMAKVEALQAKAG